MKQADDCRAWLESYGELRVEASRLQRQHARLRDQATQVTSRLTQEPKGNGGDRENLLAALADADGEALRKHAEALKRMREIEEFIDQLPTRESRIILRLRYIDLMKWRKIKYALEKSRIYYEERQIYRLHGQALREARKIWEEQHG